MTAFTNYLAEATLGLLLLLLFYKTILEQETHFRFLRFFLVIGILLSVILPLFHFQTNQAMATLSVDKLLHSYWLPEVAFSGNTQPARASDISFWSIAGWVYVSGASVFLLIFLFRFLKLAHLIRTAPSFRLENFKIIESNEYAGTFSFFHFIFIGRDALSNAEKNQIIEHEKVHIQEFHSCDVLLLNVLGIIFWFNPFIRMYKNIFVQLHEFEADARAVKNHDTKTYCSLLARVALQSAGFSLANHFNNSLTLKRITMIRTIKKKVSQWKLVMTATLFPCMFFLLACQEQIIAQQDKPRPAQVSESDEIYLVVDEVPTYQGGHEKMSEFISQNMKYPEKARKEIAQGTVFVEFIVEKNGTVSEAAVLKGVSKECDEEALRVVKILSPWNPGKQSGKAVRVKFVLPIKFKL